MNVFRLRSLVIAFSYTLISFSLFCVPNYWLFLFSLMLTPSITIFSNTIQSSFLILLRFVIKLVLFIIWLSKSMLSSCSHITKLMLRSSSVLLTLQLFFELFYFQLFPSWHLRPIHFLDIFGITLLLILHFFPFFNDSLFFFMNFIL